jgi:hypothetical protein
MKKSRFMNRHIATVWLLCLALAARAANVVTLTGGSGAPGQEVTVTVALTNSDAVTALQLQVPLGEHLTYVSGSVEKGERLGDSHTVTAGVRDGVLNVMVYSTSLATIAAGDGTLLTLRLAVGDEPADIELQPSRLTLTATDGTAVDGTALPGQVSIRCAKAQYSTMTVSYGRVPIRSTYHESLTVTNVGNEPLEVTALTFSDPTVFSTATELPFTVAPGGQQAVDIVYAPTVRGTVQKTVSVVCNSISRLNTIKLAAEPFAVNELHVGNATGVSDTEVEVSLTMNNMDPIIGFQTEFKLPAALEYVDGSFALNGERRQDHVASVVTRGDTLRIVAYSLTGQALTGDDGPIGTFRVRLQGRKGVTLTPYKTILTAVIDGQTMNVLSAQTGGAITIRSPRFSGNSTLSFGSQPVTQDVQQTYTVRNYGSAPLTISRVVFLDEGYEVAETLPLTVDANKSMVLTVKRTDKTEGDFSTTMQLYSNDPEQRLTSVAVSGNVYAPNYLTVTTDDGYQGGDLVAHVATDNYDPVAGLQFDISSDCLFVLSGSSFEATARAQGLNVTARQSLEVDGYGDTTGHTIHVVAYLFGSSIARGSGEVFTLRLTPEEPLPTGQHRLSVSNVKVGTDNLQEKYAGQSTVSATFSVSPPMAGDANGDGETDVLDVVLTVNHIIGKTPTGFNALAADMNGDGTVDVLDIVTLVNIIIGKQ